MADATATTAPSTTKVFSGAKYGRLTALRLVDGERWLFLCSCGAEKIIRRRNVEKGTTQSCGCYQRDMTSKAKVTHGHSRANKVSPTFSSYRNMIARCYRPSNNRYYQYGGRGISVCERWRNSFEHFLADMGERPSPDHSIERVDNDGNYTPLNCKWMLGDGQARNRSSNLTIEVDGEAMIIAEAARRYSIPYSTLKARIVNYGWPAERAVYEPIRKTKRW